VSEEHLRALVEQVSRGELSPDEALQQLSRFPIDELPYAQVDHLRPLLQGFPEVVFCQGKTVEQVLGICESLEASSGGFLATREAQVTGAGLILVVTAGTSDLPVAEEAAVVARAMGNRVEVLADVGVAGIHRILRQSELLNEASVLIVVAGMDGALASVVGGMVRVPVIAVPTSVGYGAAFEGISALLAMLNSCASGVVVVNIDNGFGAAVAASRINHLPS
jgi:NCAIR mutase (PurE)-related protein